MSHKQFDFSQISYEYVHHESSLPFKVFFISIGFRGFHWHKDIELILVLKGKVDFITKDGVRHLREGDLFLTNPNDFHGLVQGKEGNLLLVLQVDPDLSDGYHKNLRNNQFRLSPDQDRTSRQYTAICKALVRIMIEVLEKREGFDSFCMGEVYSIIGLISRYYPDPKAGTDRDRENWNRASRLKKMLNYINEHHQEKITLEDLAVTLGLSTYYVSHLMKQYTGYSFQENLGLIRTQHAIKLMMNSDNRLIDIAMEVGFSDIKYFNKYFRNIFSMTPRELRRLDNWQALIAEDHNLSEESTERLLEIIREYL